MEKDPTTSAYYPLSADALRAIDAIEYITNHLKQDEEYKMVFCFSFFPRFISAEWQNNLTITIIYYFKKK